MSLFFGVRPRAVTLPDAPRILVVRLDERLGNLLMLLPLLDTLAARFPRGTVDVLVNRRGLDLLSGRAAPGKTLLFDKRALFAPHGPLRSVFALRRARYDLAIDASNPTDPSFTQGFLVRMCGASHTLGPSQAGFGRLFSAPVWIEDDGRHEIDLRLALLEPLPGDAFVRSMVLPELPTPPEDLDHWLLELGSPFGVVNVGARVPSKHVPRSVYASAAKSLQDAGWTPVITYGPREEDLAREVAGEVPGAALAPPTDIPSLAHLLGRAKAVITADTGPMHLAVAAGAPTCGLFISTSPSRFGYKMQPHRAIVVSRSAPHEAVEAIRAWVSERSAP